MGRVRVFFVTIAIGLFIPAGVQAVELGPVRINGFVSQGYLYSDKNNFLSDSTRGGSFQLNEVGLAVQSQLTDKLHVGAQVLSRDLGRDGNNNIRLDWGYGDYHFRDYLGVRLGKVKLPFGLYNEGRDSDFLRPMVFLPQSIYDENKRDLLVGYQGAGLYGNVPLGPIGDMDYHGYIGTINFQENSVFVTSLKQNVSSLIKTGAGNQGAILTGFEMNNDYITGGTVTFNPPVPGLKLGMSFLKVSNILEYTSTNVAKASVKGRFENKATYVGSMEYSIGGLTLAGEYSETQHRNGIFPGVSGAYDFQAYYGMATYNLLDNFSLSILYDVFYQNIDDKEGNTLVAQRKPAYMGWRKDLGVGVRYDVNPNWTLKAEYHYVDGVALNMTGYNNITDLKRYWSYLVLKASFNF